MAGNWLRANWGRHILGGLIVFADGGRMKSSSMANQQHGRHLCSGRIGLFHLSTRSQLPKSERLW
jgi:hypothetical protein